MLVDEMMCSNSPDYIVDIQKCRMNPDLTILSIACMMKPPQDHFSDGLYPDMKSVQPEMKLNNICSTFDEIVVDSSSNLNMSDLIFQGKVMGEN